MFQPTECQDCERSARRRAESQRRRVIEGASSLQRQTQRCRRSLSMGHRGLDSESYLRHEVGVNNVVEASQEDAEDPEPRQDP